MLKKSKLKPNSNHDELYKLTHDYDTDAETLREIFEEYPEAGSDIMHGIASHHSTPPDILDKVLVLHWDDPDVREAIADNNSTSLNTLKKMVNEEQDYSVLEILAGNNNLTADLLLALYTEFFDEDSKEANRIINAIASHINTPVDILTEIAGSDIESRRSSVASNPKTPPNVLSILSKDLAHSVLENLSKNVNLPTDVIKSLVYKYGDDIYIGPNLAKYPKKITSDILEILLDSKFPMTVLEVAKNIKTPTKVLNTIYNNYKEYAQILICLEENPNASTKVKNKYFKRHKEDKVNDLKEEEKIPKIDYADKFSQGISGKANTDLELLQRLKGYLKNE